jgi:hypothetical protein
LFVHRFSIIFTLSNSTTGALYVTTLANSNWSMKEKSKHVHFRSAKMVLYTLFSEKMIFPTIFTQLSQQNDFPHHFLHSFLSKMVFATIFTEFAAAGKRYSKAKHLFW